MQKNQNQVVNYNITNAELAEMKDELTGLELYDDLKAGIARCRVKRVEIDKERKSLNEDALRHQRAVNEEASRITNMLFEIETPLKEKKKVIDDEKDRIKQEKIDKNNKRVEEIDVKINAIMAFDSEALRCNTSDEAKKVYEYVDSIEVDESFEEFQGKAINIKTQCLLSIATTISAKEEQEIKAEEILAEEKRLRIEQEEVAKANRVIAEELRIKNEKAAEELRVSNEKAAEENRIAKEKNDKLAAELKEANDKVADNLKKIDEEKAESERLRKADEKRKKDEVDALAVKEAEEKKEEERIEKLKLMRPDVEQARDAIAEVLLIMESLIRDADFVTADMTGHFSEVIGNSMRPLNYFLESTQDLY